MRRFAAVVFFLALVLLASAIIGDRSVLNTGYACKSELHVRVYGSGQSPQPSTARTKCKVSCKSGAPSFKFFLCPKLCEEKSPDNHCSLCFPNKDKWINLCRHVIDFGVRRCEESCEVTALDIIGPDYIVRGSSKFIYRRFPSKWTID